MITILSGTNRPDSNTRRVAGLVLSIHQELKVPSRLLDLAEMPAEIFAPTSYAARPASFERFAQAVLESRGLVVVTPEYNGSMPGVLKYFIDMLKFPESFERRPVCFVGLSAGMWGALRAVEQLQQIFGYRNAFIYPERVFLPQVRNLMDDAGKFKDPEVVARLRKQASGFAGFVDRMGERVSGRETV